MTAQKRFRNAFLSVCVMALLGGCASSQFDGTTYRDDDVAFRLGPVPGDSRQVESTESRLAFQNEAAGSTIAVGARCDRESDDVPLPALVQHLFLQFEDRETLSEREFVLDDRAALEVELLARLDGVQRHFIVVVMKKNGCVYDFLHVARAGDAPALRASRQGFRDMVAGFEVRD